MKLEQDLGAGKTINMEILTMNLENSTFITSASNMARAQLLKKSALSGRYPLLENKEEQGACGTPS